MSKCKYILKEGDVFGEWTVIDSTPIGRHRQYLCRCSCGLTDNRVRAADLVLNKSTRCTRCSGFLGIDDLSGTYISTIKKRARNKGRDYDISVEYLLDLFIKQDSKCALSGESITLHRNYTKGNREKQTASIDRIDSSKGYIEGNIQWVHKDINLMKNNLDENYFKNLCKKVTEYENK